MESQRRIIWTPYKFEYPRTRKFKWKYFHNVLLVLLFLWFAIVAYISVASQLYQSVPIYSTNFNSTVTLWYEYILPPTPWIAPSKVCLGSIIKVQECIGSLFS